MGGTEMKDLYRFDHCATDGSTPLGQLSTFFCVAASPRDAEFKFNCWAKGKRESTSWGLAGEYKKPPYPTTQRLCVHPPGAWGVFHLFFDDTIFTVVAGPFPELQDAIDHGNTLGIPWSETNPYPGHVPKEPEMTKNEDKAAERFARAHALQKEGYYIGPRDPKRNTVFKGAWMVCANPDFDNATLDGSVGGYCIVGDDLDDLIDTAFNNLLD